MVQPSFRPGSCNADPNHGRRSSPTGPMAAATQRIANLTDMTDFATSFRRPEDRRALPERASSARAAACEAAAQYIRIRRQCQSTVDASGELLAHATECQERLRESLTTYVAALRVGDVPPERAIVMVKATVLQSEPMPDKHYRHVVEEAVTWAVDAYYAA